jgi:hypothetical protein
MPAYRAMVEGRNFLINVDGKDRRVGFYQTVFVQGADPGEAESNAIAFVKSDVELKEATQNRAGDPPTLCLDSLEEIESLEAAPTVNGRSYFAEKRWWQFWL